jgi:hypothetical protein
LIWGDGGCPVQENTLQENSLPIVKRPDRLHETESGELNMTTASSPRSSRLKVREHRERLRAQGLRPIQIWVPDVNSPAFRAEAHRQSLAVAASAQDGEDQAFIDALTDWSVKDWRDA